MATYKWSISQDNTINGLTYIKDTDNKIQATMDDLVDFVNAEGVHEGQGLTYDFVDRLTSQTITGIKTFSNGLIGNVTGDVNGSLVGNADTATKLATTRTISLTGDITGSATFNGTANATINTVYAENPFPSGGIIMWSGLITAIPDGWLLCNGLNGTPNLVDRFIVGAGGAYTEGATGGSADAIAVAHSHTFSGETDLDGEHSHTYKTGDYIGGGGSYDSGDDRTSRTLTYNTSTSGSHTHTISGTTGVAGESGTNKNLPPYYALAYIMKA